MFDVWAAPGMKRRTFCSCAALMALMPAVLTGCKPKKASAAFWRQRLARITEDGQISQQALDMHTLRGKALLINYWAVWCPPCLAEMPMFESYYSAHKGDSWQMLGICVESKSAEIQEYLTGAPVTYPLVIGGPKTEQIMRKQGDWEGVVPFSLLISASGVITHRKMGQLQYTDLQAWLS